MKTKPTQIALTATAAAKFAQHWGVSTRTVRAWLARGLPIESDEGMAAWYAGLSYPQQRRTSRAFRARLAELRKGAATGAQTGTPDADFKAFEREYEKSGSSDENTLANLKKQMAFFLHRHRAASERSDVADAAECMRQVSALSSVVHDFEIRQQRLGRDLGDLVPRAELENCARFIGYHLLRCADSALAKLATEITERDPGLPPITVQEVKAIGEPLLLTALVFEPMQKAMAGTNAGAPPAFLVAALKEGLDEVLE